MGKVIAFKRPEAAKQDGALATTLEEHRQRLAKYFHEHEFPAQQYLDLEFRAPALERAGHDHLKEMFEFFGIVDLDPSCEDFDLVLNTWFESKRQLGTVAHGRWLMNDVIYKVESPSWHPVYRDYIDAMWFGDRAGVLKNARLLGITKGIPAGAPFLSEGPLHPSS